MKYVTIIAIIIIFALIILAHRIYVYYMNHPWIFKKQIHHKKFGRLWYIKCQKESINNHYQGYHFFQPVNKEVDLFFETDEEGLNEQQESFFDQIEERINEIVATLKNPVEKKTGIKINSFEDEFELNSILLSSCIDSRHKWRLGYNNKDHKKGVHHDIYIILNEWEIENIEYNKVTFANSR